MFLEYIFRLVKVSDEQSWQVLDFLLSQKYVEKKEIIQILH